MGEQTGKACRSRVCGAEGHVLPIDHLVSKSNMRERALKVFYSAYHCSEEGREELPDWRLRRNRILSADDDDGDASNRPTAVRVAASPVSYSGICLVQISIQISLLADLGSAGA